ncbi:MAG: hypothetical protein JWO64_2503, partial [Hyphomicrobiales bacterium]|nr:hypothetical protein [Hyphomicrobiales bacterium]
SRILKKIWICAAAIGAALVFSAPASARDNGRGKHHGYAYGHGQMKHAMPMRSNKYGKRHGHERAGYVHSMNRRGY